MTLLIVDKDYLKAEIYSDQLDPIEPKVTNTNFERFLEFDLFVGNTVRSDTYDQGQLKSETQAAAAWAVNPRAKPAKGSRDIRAWDFSDEVGGGDITVEEILSVVKDANVRNYWLEIIRMVTYWKISAPTDLVPTFTAAGDTWRIPGSYNVDGSGNATTQKTWEEWAGTNQTIFGITGATDPTDNGFWVASFAGVPGNVPTSGILLYLMDLKSVVEKIYSTKEFQAIQGTP